MFTLPKTTITTDENRPLKGPKGNVSSSNHWFSRWFSEPNLLSGRGNFFFFIARKKLDFNAPKIESHYIIEISPWSDKPMFTTLTIKPDVCNESLNQHFWVLLKKYIELPGPKKTNPNRLETILGFLRILPAKKSHQSVSPFQTSFLVWRLNQANLKNMLVKLGHEALRIQLENIRYTPWN